MGYRQAQRFAEKSKFSLRKILSFVLDGITAYSRCLCVLLFILPCFFGVLSFGLTLDVVYTKLFTTDAVPI